MRVAGFAVVSVLAVAVAGCQSSPASEDLVIAPSPPPVVMAPPPPPSGIVVTGSRMAGAVQEWASPVSVVDASQAQAKSDYRYVPPVIVPTDPGTERYDGKEVSPVKIAAAEPLSTFSVDVDTGAYANARRFLTQGQMPPKDAVRTEEFINYFRYDYTRPADEAQPFSVSFDAAQSPWNAETRLVRIGLAGYTLPEDSRPPANLVFLIDVSGSMFAADKLPLVKTALIGLANQLTKKDKVSIVVYAGAAGLVLDATSNPAEIRNAINDLEAGGSTAGGAGIELAYRVAEANFIKGGVNRVILATDGDFNVGLSNTDALIEMIEKKRESGVTLTTLGFGQGNYNEALMEQLANKGNGNYAYIDSAIEAKKVLGEEMGSTIFTIAKDVKIQVEFNPAVVSQYRLIGYENRALRNEDFDNDAVDAGDIGAGHQVTAIYEVVLNGSKGWIPDRRYGDKLPASALDQADEAAYVKLRYKLPDGETSKLIDFVLPASKLKAAGAPKGDFAFAAAVAGFGQKLRGDPLLNGFSYDQLASLAGKQDDFYRQEFVKLAGVAGGMTDLRTMGGDEGQGGQ
ncbi:VWA domain-containing protein [Erythrobacter sp. SDW2]|uniref:vWA domain-containing protein n=1 Tax=Erythrobacter sp. SDW2 TaxID=2907154 RepID=UPI001F1AAD03|nr:VWA domain-containing protein [Erythrobacter sp. SDW2]UIP07870.1 VWA domain-containing protein [Erythrobacter sp. SDW2]